MVEENDQDEEFTLNVEKDSVVINDEKKKKRKKKKKKPTTVVQPVDSSDINSEYKGSVKYSSSSNKNVDLGVDNSLFRRLGDWRMDEKYMSHTLNKEATQPLKEYFSEFPSGECVEYVSCDTFGQTSTEKKHLDCLLLETELKFLRHAAECHRQTRRFAQSICRPGIKLIDLCQKLEAKSKQLIGESELNGGWGFPTGCSIDHIAAHFTPNSGCTVVLHENNIMKLDFGVHVAGRIIDCAFCVAFDPKFDPLIQSTQEATNEAIKRAGVDVQISELSSVIQETIESFEMVVDGKVIPIKPIENLTGHSIGNYRIHGDKTVPNVKTGITTRMEEGDLFAIETFASTGKGFVVDTDDCSHYMRNPQANRVQLRTKMSRGLLSSIDRAFGTLPFCRRWLDDIGCTRHQFSLRSLVESDLVAAYPPLTDMPGSFTSQMEHTLLIRPTCVEVLSRGPDF